MIDRNNYCKDCDRSIYATGALARSCDSNIENNGKYTHAGKKCYCKIVNGKMAEKYPWEENLTCKDCVHYNLCTYNTYEKAKSLGEDEKKLITIKNNVPCKFFACSSSVNLPFKVGDRIYVPWKDRGSLSTRKYTDIMPLKILAIGSTEDSPEWFIKTAVCSFKVSEYRKRFFTLLKEAENALKEGVDNA